MLEAESSLHGLGDERSEEVAWACGRRFVPRLKRLPKPPAPEAPIKSGYLGTFSDSSSCIVVGGNGSLGRLLVASLGECGQLSDLIIATRSCISHIMFS